MIRSRTGGRDRAGLIDALSITTGLAVLSWAFLMRPITADPSLTLGSRLISLAYPLADVLLLGADVVYAGLTAVGAYSGGLLDHGWMVSYLCWGAAALHPSVRSLSEVLLYQGSRDLPIDWAAPRLGSVVLFLLVVARMSELVARVQDQAAQLAALAHNDALTGIPNRRAWDLDLVREMARARRSGAPLHLALLDIDHLKRFNDTTGTRPVTCC